MHFEDKNKNISIVADKIQIGESVILGKNIHIRVKGEFSIGNYSRLGNNTEIYGNNVFFGEHLFNSSGLRIGGGGRQHPNANFKIGDRCTIHNNFINVCEPVEIGNDVGLSPETSIITHGYWLSVLEGYPASFAGVKIGNGVIIGYRSVLLMGVEIADFCVVGANSVVSKSLLQKAIYAGSPAKFIKEIKSLSLEKKQSTLLKVLEEYMPIAQYHGINPEFTVEYPKVKYRDFIFNAETFEYDGIEDEETDDLRDYIRKWGLRIYTKRPFQSIFEW
jgi:acetyltransferase-like isoleucine patch superfamily enzyme